VTPPAPAGHTRPASLGADYVANAPPNSQAQVGVSRPSLRPPGERRRLAPEDVKDILEIIWDPLYGVEARKLLAILDKPEGVSLEEYNEWCRRTQPEGDETSWETVLRGIGKRFRTAWEKGLKPQSPLSVRLSR
jgi:hypothetical protein